MILEGVVTTIDAEGNVNVAPMGPIVDASMQALCLRPYRTSRTYQNLKQHPQGVFHVTDDVLLLARAAIGQLHESPALQPAERVKGWVLSDACRWYEFEIRTLNDSQDRCEIESQVLHTGRLRDFFGFNRAKHAVLEAAILATRIHLLPPADVMERFEQLRDPVIKTAGPAEREAFTLLLEYVSKQAQ